MSNKSGKPEVKIENWVKHKYGVNSETSQPQYVLRGDVENHPRLGKSWVRTSLIVSTDDKTYAETLNTYYVLGEPAK